MAFLRRLVAKQNKRKHLCATVASIPEQISSLSNINPTPLSFLSISLVNFLFFIFFFNGTRYVHLSSCSHDTPPGLLIWGHVFCADIHPKILEEILLKQLFFFISLIDERGMKNWSVVSTDQFFFYTSLIYSFPLVFILY